MTPDRQLLKLLTVTSDLLLRLDLLSPTTLSLLRLRSVVSIVLASSLLALATTTSGLLRLGLIAEDLDDGAAGHGLEALDLDFGVKGLGSAGPVDSDLDGGG